MFNLPPVDGEPARFGFTVIRSPVIIDIEVDPDNQYRIIATVRNATQVPKIISTILTVWGTPETASTTAPEDGDASTTSPMRGRATGPRT